MTPAQVELARRAVACKGWHWRCGMLISDGAWFSRVGSGYNWKIDADLLPDLADPATLGCLLALVRAVYPDAYTVPQFGGGWEVASPVDADVVGDGLSEAEALVAALESAP